MILIADSGSTKTDWCFFDTGICNKVSTQGINPFHQSGQEISSIIINELLPQSPNIAGVRHCFFYGAGCTPEKSLELASALCSSFSLSASNVSVASDLLGAARALCGDQEGIACILGTGSNSCYYDGNVIASHVSPLGYILGDEGSAAYIGKRLVGNCLKTQFSQSTCDLFFRETQLTPYMIIENVYRKPMPNRFLGNISQFCQHHLDIPEIELFVVDCFVEFLTRNVKAYNRPDLPINVIGSIAEVYKKQLSIAIDSCGMSIGKIMRTPMPGLIEYHSK